MAFPLGKWISAEVTLNSNLWSWFKVGGVYSDIFFQIYFHHFFHFSEKAWKQFSFMQMKLVLEDHV